MIIFNDEKKGKISSILFGIAAGLYVLSLILSLTSIGRYTSGYSSVTTRASSWGAIIGYVINAALFGFLAYTLGTSKKVKSLKIIMLAFIIIQFLALVLGMFGLSVAGSSVSIGLGAGIVSIVIGIVFLFCTYGLLYLYINNIFSEGESKPISAAVYMVPLVIFSIIGALGVLSLFAIFSRGPVGVFSALCTIFSNLGFVLFILATKPVAGTMTVNNAPQPVNNTPTNNMESDSDVLTKLNELKTNGTITSEEFDKMKNRVLSGTDEGVKSDIREIESIKELLDSGAITPEEFQNMKEPFFGF